MDGIGSGLFLSIFAGQFAMVAMWLSLIGVAGLIALYVIARRRAAAQDPQLGMKFVSHVFATAAFSLTLAALALALFSALSSLESDDKATIYRVAFGILVPGIVVVGTHILLTRRSNQREFPTIHRLFIGFNVLTTGFIAFGALLFWGQTLCSKGSAGDVGKAALAMVLIYGPSWIALGWRFVVLTTKVSAPAPTKSIDLRVSL